MEFTPSPSSIFQNKKIKYNNKKPTKNGIIWINFSKIRKARCTLTPLSLRSARLTQYMRFARCTSLSHILLRFTTQNIAYTETLSEIIKSFLSASRIIIWGYFLFFLSRKPLTKWGVVIKYHISSLTFNPKSYFFYCSFESIKLNENPWWIFSSKSNKDNRQERRKAR